MVTKKHLIDFTLLEHNFDNLILPLVEEKIKHTISVASKIKNKSKRNLAINTIKRKSSHLLGSCIFASILEKEKIQFALDFYFYEAVMLDYLDEIIEIDKVEHKFAKKLHWFMERVIMDDKKAIKLRSRSMDSKYILFLSNNAKKSFIKSIDIYDEEYIRKCFVAMKDFCRSQSYSCLPKELRKKYYSYWHKKSVFTKDIEFFEHGLIQASPIRAYLIASFLFCKDLEKNKNILKSANNIGYWLGAINVFGDQLIDFEDDKKSDSVNQLVYYGKMDKTLERMIYFIEKAYSSLLKSEQKKYYYFVFFALLVMYIRPVISNKGWIKLMSFFKAP